jgi:hypothetical protein
LADRAGNQKPGLARSQPLPGNAFPEAEPRLNRLTNAPFSPLLKPHDRQNIDVILKSDKAIFKIKSCLAIARVISKGDRTYIQKSKQGIGNGRK